MPTKVDDLFPSRYIALKFWQVYLINVDPILKILHIPEAQKIIYAAINDHSCIDSCAKALVFATYFAVLS
ncbi:MAG: hypothetical protein MMC23_008827 [Stictis urceolatum]|nr:hypothetical protein [Stictis urceolata]